MTFSQPGNSQPRSRNSVLATDEHRLFDKVAVCQDLAAMCFRYSAKKNEARIKFKEKTEVFGMVPHEDVRPTDFGPVLLPEEDALVCREMRWGWHMPWQGGSDAPVAPDDWEYFQNFPGDEASPPRSRNSSTWAGKLLFNAKSETLTQLPTFKPHLQNRCLILADGFYEKGIRFIQPGEPVFCMAGLWREETVATLYERRGQDDGHRPPLQTDNTLRYTLLTTTPNDSIAPYHHRMPFILKPDQYDDWLGGKWQSVLNQPDKSALDKIQKQPELF